MTLVYDEPSARWHRVAGFAPSPDPQRPGWQDPRVVLVWCGMVIALVGVPTARPAVLTSCPGCFDG